MRDGALGDVGVDGEEGLGLARLELDAVVGLPPPPLEVRQLRRRLEPLLVARVGHDVRGRLDRILSAKSIEKEP